ncbi:MAG: LysE family translocator [Bacteroidales bacterium]|jgi:threonine/homoserine/homoserine lactone efflux protein
MEISGLLSFIAVSMLLTISPGPDILYVATQSITSGKRAGIATAMGLCTGLIVHTTAAAFGVSEILRQSAIAFSILKYAGAAYLFYLAWQAFKEGGFPYKEKDLVKKNGKSLYLQGIYMNILNPKVALFFLAFLPQFVNIHTGNIPAQMVLLGSLFILQAIVIFTLVAVFAGIFGDKLAKNQKLAKRINYIKGSVFILIGAKLALGEIK